ncbi:hypothetical protein AXE65_11585 [Ventosimonas gracilis]|uniref:Outer membrane protein beta-barrel domain-containing protein n=1 Tax=Ventosimonas gracilis TaxID=1680762 RepID=A0A139SW70_9GAMM|nr:hypothetical protein [Ventosimonas gracilis]KXU38876.1 hypothetical protein AXE65_11585 [Ventosimonas gracilis]
MNLFTSKCLRRGTRSTAAALTLLTAAVSTTQAAPPENYGISYTWLEGGWSRHNDRANNGNYDLDGGYLRGSFALGDNFYLIGSYSRNQDTASTTDGIITVKLKTAIAQGELGLGVHVPMAERLDFIGELVGMYFDYDYKMHVNGQKVDFKYDDHDYAGKALVGLRAKPFDMLDIWGKVGYFKIQDADNSTFPVRKSPLGNIGVQLQLTPNFGLVGEADFYKKDLRYYRAGVRVSF